MKRGTWARVRRWALRYWWLERQRRRRLENRAERAELEAEDLRVRLRVQLAENILLGRRLDDLRHHLEKARLPDSMPRE